MASRDSLRESAKHIIGVLNDHNIFYWADYGTLLGIIRDGDIIKHDDDIDLSVLASDWHKVKKIDFGENYKRITKKGDAIWDKVYRYENGNQVTSCDLFYWRMDKARKVYREHLVYKYEKRKFDYVKYISEMDTVNVWGIDINIPKHVEDFLQMRYGDWETVKKEKGVTPK